MSARVIPELNYENETKTRILEISLNLFARKGFSAVSTRDIAQEAGINIATLYYYYKSKDELLEEIFAFFATGYIHYFDWLRQMNENAKTLDEVMDNMFNEEFIQMHDIMACLGMSLAIKEQHNHESARKCVFDLFYGKSIEYLKADFDALVQKGTIPPSDTKTIATLFMFCVIVSNDTRIHEYMGFEPPIESAAIYTGLKSHITNVLKAGILDNR